MLASSNRDDMIYQYSLADNALALHRSSINGGMHSQWRQLRAHAIFMLS